MRLLHIESNDTPDPTLQISFSEFVGSNVPPYAILSHRWREQEVLYDDMVAADRSVARSKKGYAKLEMTCQLALEYGLSYVWSDTCCIDKSSSAELSEAINSMYSYYTHSAWCIAYLDDVEFDEIWPGEYLSRSAWFSRGWTLQELIAPLKLTFYAKSWNKIGTKADLCVEVSLASNIAVKVLRDREAISAVGVSEKMSWAAKRVTTRPEDEAYSLMGIFGVNMATLYGEGRSSAFRRLQLEILHTTTDHTLFAWDSETVNGDMLAPSVSCFSHGANYGPSEYPPGVIDRLDPMPYYDMTNAGLRIQLPMRGEPERKGLYSAILACNYKLDPRFFAAIYISRLGGSSNFPRFCREVYFGGTLHLVQRQRFQGRLLDDVGSKPIWIAGENHLPRQSFEVAYPLMDPDWVRWRGLSAAGGGGE